VTSAAATAGRMLQTPTANIFPNRMILFLVGLESAVGRFRHPAHVNCARNRANATKPMLNL
jgi:hypothetical protein